MSEADSVPTAEPAVARPFILWRLLRQAIALPSQLLAAGLIVGVLGYRVLLRPLLPSVCRYYPSCSEYFIQAVRKHGPVRGGCRGVWRVCRCNPWSRGGYDPP
jgi:putative membrane protein insertion efficiency factor